MGASIEIRCEACGAEALLRREPVYDGFKKTGEKLFCSSCGHEYSDEESVQSKTGGEGPSVFSDADRSAQVDVFSNDEKEKNCRRCTQYVLNPFTQRCSLHQKEVEATDVCFDFEVRKDEPEEPEEDEG